MTDQEMERSIQQAFEHSTPDVLSSVLTACDQQKGTVIKMTNNEKKKKSWIPRVAGLAAALALVVGAGFGWSFYQANYVAASTVSLDVNPSIQITVNRMERVLDVSALNEDGKTILDGMDFEGSDIDVTVNAIIGSMLRKGYLTEMANSILVSVDSKDAEKGAELEKKLAQEVNTLLQSKTFSGAVISQAVASDDKLEALADQYGISNGKAKLIQRITEQNTRYTFEELAGLSINELNLLSVSGNLHLNNVTSTGSASDKGYIGTDAAKQAALDHAGVADADIFNFEIDMELEKGLMVYEIEFNTTDHEYEYDINATTGEVVWQEKEVNRDEDGKPAVTPDSTTSITTPTLIGKDAAKSAAIAHAGVSADNVTAYECELDRDHGGYIYEIEFNAGDYEYDYDINAETGAVIKHEKELKDDKSVPSGATSPTSPTLISKEDAKTAALTHAGVAADAIREYDIELDTENGKSVYEIEFKSAGVEYSYEIDAVSGAIIKSEKEIDD